MTRFLYDQFAKQYLAELLNLLGEVETSRDVPGEVRQIDVWYKPKNTPETDPKTLGLLGRFAANTCLLEPFRNPVTITEIRNCVVKLFQVQAQLQRQANREDGKITEENLPLLWIITPTASEGIINGFRAILDENNWMKGIYFFGEYFRTAIVVIHQLPRSPETLWLRILGKGKVQKQAIDELTALPKDNPLRTTTLELMYSLQANLQATQNLDEEDREFIMQLSPLYLQQIEDAVQKGKAEGRLEGRLEGKAEGRLEGRLEGKAEGQLEGEKLGKKEAIRQSIESIIEIKFGEIDQELSQIIEPLMQLPQKEAIKAIMQLSRDELIQRFANMN